MSEESTSLNNLSRSARRKRSKNGERRQRTLMHVDKMAVELATQLATALGISKVEVINFALSTLANAVQEEAAKAAYEET